MSANIAKVVQKLVKPLEERIAALEAKAVPVDGAQALEVSPKIAEEVAEWQDTRDFSVLKARAAMHNNAAYLAGWAEIHEDGKPMTHEQQRQLMEMFRRVLAGPKKRKARTKTSTTE
jgi:hypothetical protein